jgi:hypothetical protein
MSFTGSGFRLILCGSCLYQGPASPQAKDRHVVAWKEDNRAETQGDRKRKKREVVASTLHVLEEHGTGLLYLCNLSTGQQFQGTADTLSMRGIFLILIA